MNHITFLVIIKVRISDGVHQRSLTFLERFY